MSRFRYDKYDEENLSSYYDWDFKNENIYYSLLKILRNDIRKFSENILVNYEDVEEIKKKLQNYLSYAEKIFEEDSCEHVTIEQTNDYLTFESNTLDYDTDINKINSLIIKNDWKEFYFISYDYDDNRCNLDRFVLNKNNKISHDTFKELHDFEIFNDTAIDASISKLNKLELKYNEHNVINK